MESFVNEFLPDVRSSALGKLGIIEFNTLPFVPKRIYWLSEVPVDAERGHHAHKKLSQLLYVMAGSVELVIHKGSEKKIYQLDQTSPAMILRPGLWRELKNFQNSALVLVFCDEVYEENDYIRDYKDYLDWFSINHG